MTPLVVATTNTHKLREIRRVLGEFHLDVRDLTRWPPVPEPEETGATFQANATLKALHYDRYVSSVGGAGAEPPLIVAEDSGLVIDALDGEPGVRSARFLRQDASYPERFTELARRLAKVADRPRTARFLCALAAARGGRIVFETTGTIEGEIAGAPRGAGGFGYDAIFYYPPYGATLAEVDEDAKLRVAHRGRAFRTLAQWLRTGDGLFATPDS